MNGGDPRVDCGVRPGAGRRLPCESRIVAAGGDAQYGHIVAMACMVWLALTNPNAATASSRSPERTKPPLLTVSRALRAASGFRAATDEFLALGRGQAIAAQPFIESGLLEPLPSRLSGGFELARQRGYAPTGARQFDGSSPVFLSVLWMRFFGIGVLLLTFSPTPSTRTGQLEGLRTAGGNQAASLTPPL
jgi:hypothetical protein